MARRVPDKSPDSSRPRPRVRLLPGTLERQCDEVLMHWCLDSSLSQQTTDRFSETVLRFTSRLRATSVTSFDDVEPRDARAFVLAPLSNGQQPQVHTRHARRTVLRLLYKTLRILGHAYGDPTLDLRLPPRGNRAARPLTIDEIILCRASALATSGKAGSMRATAWALGEATAVSSEITQIRLSDLDDPEWPTFVQLPGTTRVRPRESGLSDWGCLVLTERCRQLRAQGATPETLLAYGGDAPPGGAKAQASVCNALRDVLDSAGLAAEPDIRPSSLRHWAGRAHYDNGASIQAVANYLGHRSLDATAQDIALTWASTLEPATPTANSQERP